MVAAMPFESADDLKTKSDKVWATCGREASVLRFPLQTSVSSPGRPQVSGHMLRAVSRPRDRHAKEAALIVSEGKGGCVGSAAGIAAHKCSMRRQDILEAFLAHPKIGDSKGAKQHGGVRDCACGICPTCHACVLHPCARGRTSGTSTCRRKST